MSHLDICCLGSFQAKLDGQPITGFESGKVRALLVYLALEADEPHSRDELIGLLWPDRPESAARANLRQAVANLREAIGDRAAEPPFLIITGDAIQFNRHSHYGLDVAAFEDQLQYCATHVHRRLEACPACAEHLRAAADLYRGDFLTRFYQNSEPFEEWALLVRERLHRAGLSALYELADYYERRADYPAAQRYALRQIELDPWREEAHRQVMRALALSGQRSAALAQYEKCRRLLADELDVEPASTTRDLAEQIKLGGLSVPPSALSLPLASTPLIGRERELSEVNRLILNSHCHVVTLVGPGGVGKTQLALSIAEAQSNAFSDGVRYVALEDLTSAEDLAATLIRALDLMPDGASPPLVKAATYLAHREMLIVLDNFEQLLPAGAEMLAALMAQAPRIVFMVTSRVRLNLREEWVIEINGLSVPANDCAINIADYSALQLFVSRVERVRGSTALSNEDLQDVARICRMLSGLPLGLELAASASYRRSFAEIALELERSFDSLTAPPYDLPQRHRSLRAVFEQSWRLLSPLEREVVQVLAVFRGGFDLAAAERVAGATPSTLLALRDKSLLQEVAPGRYDLPELIRQYAEEQRRSGSTVDRACERHSAYYCEQTALAELHLVDIDYVQWMAQIDTDLNNVRFALQWSSMARPEHALEMAGRLWRYWEWRGSLTEGRWWLEQALNAAREGENGRARAEALAGAAHLAWSQGDFEASRQWAEQSVLLWRALTDSQGLAHALIVLGMAAGSLGDRGGATAALEESISLCRTSQDDWGLAMALLYRADGIAVPQPAAVAQALLSNSLALFESLSDQCGVALAAYGLGSWALHHGDYSLARAWLERALHDGRVIGDRYLIAQALEGLGDVAGSEKQVLQAERHYTESLALYREMGAHGRAALLLHHLGSLALERPDAPRAVELFAESLDIFRQLNNQRGVAQCLEGLAGAKVVCEEHADAVPLFGLASRLRASLNILMSAAERYTHEDYLSVARSHLDAAHFSEAWAAGYAMSVEAISLVLLVR